MSILWAFQRLQLIQKNLQLLYRICYLYYEFENCVIPDKTQPILLVVVLGAITIGDWCQSNYHNQHSGCVFRDFFFTYQHSKDYQQVQFKFLDAVESLDPNNIMVSRSMLFTVTISNSDFIILISGPCLDFS